MALTITKLILLITILYIVMKPQILIQAQQVPCLFFMGDSLFDDGNNNVLVTLAKANYLPYGIDYPDGPTGRFNNGKNIADFLAQLLGFDKPIPSFATATGSEVLKGVNYASGSAGILEDSGIQAGDRLSLNRQLVNHQLTISRIATLLKDPARVDDYLRQCLYTVNMGTNDYINNYLLPPYPNSTLFTPDQFAALLIQRYTQQLRTLYNYGARKVAVVGLGLLGCLPQQLARFPRNVSSPCVDSINDVVQLFNNRLKPLIDNMNNNLANAQFIYINITSIFSGDPSAFGIRVANAPCCVVSPTSGLCVPNEVPCSNRNEYAFWDNIHPTEITNLVTATRAYNASLPSDAYPVDIRRLVQQLKFYDILYKSE